MEKVYEFDSSFSVYRTETSNGLQLMLVDNNGGVIGIFDCWGNGSEQYCEPIFKIDYYDSHKGTYDYIINNALKTINVVPSKGEYGSTYDKIRDYNCEKRMLEERLAETTDEEEREFISEQISECEISIGECEGYLRELDYIDNGTQYW